MACAIRKIASAASRTARAGASCSASGLSNCSKASFHSLPSIALSSVLRDSSSSSNVSKVAQRIPRVLSAVARPAQQSIASRKFSSAPEAEANLYGRVVPGLKEEEYTRLRKMRNIGISAHIDSGKTTLTERILFYTGRINDIHEVKGKDGVGAKMDSMELEREKGITIQSAATFCEWNNHHINIIDTPGHVDFTIEVERSLRVLDSAILVLCGVSGVQSQSMTVDRQMKRYNVPRLAFINKLDRQGANPWAVIKQLREKLHLNAAAVQMTMGLEDNLEGIIDLVHRKAAYFDGYKGQEIRYEEVPAEYKEQMEARRRELVEKLADLDEGIAEKFLMDEEPTIEEITAAIRKNTVNLKFVPVFMGSAYKNKGVQLLLDGVLNYLPNPMEKENHALDRDANEERKEIVCDSSKPVCALAFKLEEGKFGQLTYIRSYQGTLKRGDFIVNTNNGKKIKVPRLVRMHSNDMEDVQSIGPGEICAMFGVECASGDTFTDGNINYGMTSMFVPEPVMSLAVGMKSKEVSTNFSKALNRFTKEDPTFRVKLDADSGQTIISGMGELHLEIYVERMKREYKLDIVTERPTVAYRETIGQKAEFDYMHRKQSGGQGQFGRVMGYIEPLPMDYPTKFEFLNHMVGNNIPPQFVPACEKGFREASQKGALIGHPVWGVRVVLTDGAAHAVDSSELAFKIACTYAFKQGFERANPTILEPIMKVEVQCPGEYQGTIIAQLNRRKGLISSADSQVDGTVIIQADVPLSEMFGYSTDLRSVTQGKGEFTMEYKSHNPLNFSDQQKLVEQAAKNVK